MAHEAAIIFKRNDKNTAPGKEHLGLKHGDPVDVIDNADSAWKGASIEDMMSKRMREAFGIIQIDPSKIPLFRSYLLEHVGDGSPEQYRPRIKRLNISKLGQLVGVPNLNGLLYSGQNLSIMNGMLLSEDDFDDTTLLNNKIRFEDVRAIGAGNATIGVGGAAPNYLTWNAFFADLINLIANLTGTQVNNTSEGVAALITESLGGFDLICTSDINTSGNYNNGWLTSINVDDRLFRIEAEGPGTVCFNFLKMDTTTPGALSAGRAYVFLTAITTAFFIDVNNCLLNGRGKMQLGVRTTDNTPVLRVYNNLFFGLPTGGLQIDVTDGNVNSVYENNSMYNCGAGIIANNNSGTFRNNACLGNTIDFAGTGSATGRNNASSDGTGANGNWSTGTGNQINLVTADQWQSLVAADGNTFMLPVAGSTIDQQGVAPTYATTLINGAVWGATGRPIGAKGRLALATRGRSKIAVGIASAVGF